ncbi:unnamed protein product [Mycena citricolor]|uniref:Mitochondrial pyruvate carrier n=1 Tax=Mycena citricolor TaxID=2018698 RepID=A0AAD2GXG2_9AGAR|nr:unnamed protein product [Mycena citricolor]
MSGAASSGFASKFASFMNHPAGPKTVFFWAPMMKWCLVGAGLKDMGRPAEKLSLSQNLVNYSLAALFKVNFFVGLSGLTQVARIANYRYGSKPAAIQ